MDQDIQEVLYSQEYLAGVVKELGRKISEDYKGKNLLMVSVLKGSVVFMADLMRAITIPCSIDFMSVSSYGSGVKTSGVVKISQGFGYQSGREGSPSGGGYSRQRHDASLHTRHAEPEKPQKHSALHVV